MRIFYSIKNLDVFRFFVNSFVCSFNIQVKTWRFDNSNTGGLLCIWDCIACNWILEIFLAYFWKNTSLALNTVWKFDNFPVQSDLMNSKPKASYVTRWNPVCYFTTYNLRNHTLYLISRKWNLDVGKIL